MLNSRLAYFSLLATTIEIASAEAKIIHTAQEIIDKTIEMNYTMMEIIPKSIEIIPTVALNRFLARGFFTIA